VLPLGGDAGVARRAGSGVEQRRIVGADRDRGHAARARTCHAGVTGATASTSRLATGAARDQRDQRERARSLTAAPTRVMA
jgi:hypothetical protein